jgi:hypothetical protein
MCAIVQLYWEAVIPVLRSVARRGLVVTGNPSVCAMVVGK